MGDKNNRYFQTMVTIKKQQTLFVKLKLNKMTSSTTKKEFSKLITIGFSRRFKSDTAFNLTCNPFSKEITEDNRHLRQEVSNEEILETVK